MARRSSPRRADALEAHLGQRAWIGAAAVVVLIVVVAVLAMLALDHASPPAPDERLAPVPTFGPTETEPSPSPTPTSTPVPAVARADERYLAVGSDGVLWRGVAGSCVDAASPLIERSADDGATWTDVTPLYRGLTQIMRLEAFAGTQAQAVAALADGCVTDGLRTFTQGRFWESYEEVLDSAYLSGDDAGTVVTPDGPIEAPCADARGLRGSGETIALVCDGEGFLLDDGRWSPVGVEGVVALEVEGTRVTLVHAAPDCDGLRVSTVMDASATPSACVTGVDPSAPTAIALRGDAVLVWSGTSFTNTAI